jgi:hypothetical protein
MGMLKKHALTPVKESAVPAPSFGRQASGVLRSGEKWEVNSKKVAEGHSERVDSCHFTPYSSRSLDGPF